jgi:hypothetical protein
MDRQVSIIKFQRVPVSISVSYFNIRFLRWLRPSYKAKKNSFSNLWLNGIFLSINDEISEIMSNRYFIVSCEVFTFRNISSKIFSPSSANCKSLSRLMYVMFLLLISLIILKHLEALNSFMYG